MKKKNLIAKDLRSPKYRSRIVKPKKGKGSFKRKKSKRFIFFFQLSKLGVKCSNKLESLAKKITSPDIEILSLLLGP